MPGPTPTTTPSSTLATVVSLDAHATDTASRSTFDASNASTCSRAESPAPTVTAVGATLRVATAGARLPVSATHIVMPRAPIAPPVHKRDGVRPARASMVGEADLDGACAPGILVIGVGSWCINSVASSPRLICASCA